MFTNFYSKLFNFIESPISFFYKNTEILKNDSKNFFNNLVYKNKIIFENEKLKNKIKDLETKNMKVDYLDSIVNEYNNIILYNPDIILTTIIKKNNLGTLTVLGGSDLGISIYENVLDSNGVLVGVVSRVFDYTSIISLFTKKDFESYAVVYNGKKSISIKLIGNGNAMVFEINREIEVNEGDIVYSQENPGYVVGVVSYISFDPRDPFKKVYVSPLYNLNSLQNLGIIKFIK